MAFKSSSKGYAIVPGGRRKAVRSNNVWGRTRSPVAKHAGINKAVTHPDQSKTIPRFRKHKLNEAMFDE